jgi:formamidopyrimidine-DNA glycosylase
VRDARLRWPVAPELAEVLRGRRITALHRRSKYLVFTVDSGDRVLLHLGMSGRLLVVDAQTVLRKHDHVDLLLDNGRVLRFHDPRRFGALLLWPRGLDTHPLLAHLGPEPFDDVFDGDYLHRRSRGRRSAIKPFIMDAAIVVGVGNIYATESLFHAGIRPTRAAGRLNRADCMRLAAAIREVLALAIEQGGTTLRDFAGADGHAGYFQQQLFVYGRDGEACLRCTAPVRRIVLGQRASFYCPRCQR